MAAAGLGSGAQPVTPRFLSKLKRMNRDWDQNKNHCLGESGPSAVSVRRSAYLERLDRGDAVKVTGGGEQRCGHLVDLPVVLVWFPASHLTV